MLAYDGTYITRIGTYQTDAVVQPVKDLAMQCVEYIDCLIREEQIQIKQRIFPVKYQKGDTL